MELKEAVGYSYTALEKEEPDKKYPVRTMNLPTSYMALASAHGGESAQGVPYPPPITQQPVVFGPSEGFFLDNPPPGPGQTGAPKGSFLEYLKTASRLEIRQKIDLLEIITGYETENKYVVYNDIGQPVLFVTEQSDCCHRQCFGSRRVLHMTMVDCYGTEVMRLGRPYKCQSCLCACCLQQVSVESPPDSYSGQVKQLWSVLGPRFAIRNPLGMTLFNVEGPFCAFTCCNDVPFKIKTALDGSYVGEIRKKWSGFAQEAFTDADNFCVTFPTDLSVPSKLLLISSVFLMDMMYFESSARNCKFCCNIFCCNVKCT